LTAGHPALEPVRIVCIGMSAGVLPVSAKKVLTKTRELLSKEGAWGQHAFAYDKSDERIPWDDRRACCWCLEGGIKVSARRCAASRRHYNEALDLVKEEIVTLGFFGSVQGWNDRRDTTKEIVLAVIDRAIAKA
jgi:hypothetical protein